MNNVMAVLGNFFGSSVNKRLVLLGLLGVLLMAAGGMLASDNEQKISFDRNSGNNKVTTLNKVTRNYEEELESHLANLLAQVRGAGSVGIHITLEDNGYQDSAKNIVKETKTIQEKDKVGAIRTTTESKESVQILLSKKDGIDRPIIVKEIKPAIRGVLIIAEGAYDSNVKANLIRAVEYGLGIPSYKITVLAQRR